MFILANIKDLLVSFDEKLNKLETQGESLYKYWLEIHAEPHIKRWLEQNKYNISTCRTPEYIEYITKHFIDWITGDNS